MIQMCTRKTLKLNVLSTNAFTICMECGFCEKHCPSRNLTLTPRQRIALLRETKRLETKAISHWHLNLEKAMNTSA